MFKKFGHCESEKNKHVRKQQEGKDWITIFFKITKGIWTWASQVTDRNRLHNFLCLFAHLFSQRVRRPKKCLLGPPNITDSSRRQGFAMFAFFEKHKKGRQMGRNAHHTKHQNPQGSEAFCIFQKKYFSFFTNRLFVLFHKKARLKSSPENGHFCKFQNTRMFNFGYLSIFWHSSGSC